MKNFSYYRYLGYLNTPILWDSNLIGDLEQIKFDNKSNSDFISNSINEIRLGKLVEHFVFHELALIENIEILASNIQLIENKLTIGEIDALIRYVNEYIHLEIVYKFYLYDPNVEGNEINKWIGPNRKDSLLKKIEKIKTKQFPILGHQITKSLIKQLGLNKSLFQQKVLFKAQLFVPFDMLNQSFELVNNKCIKGFYLRLNEIEKLTTTLFYFPEKLDWLLEPHLNVKWINYNEFINSVLLQLKLKRSPLCWLKNENEIINKIFIVYW